MTTENSVSTPEIKTYGKRHTSPKFTEWALAVCLSVVMLLSAATTLIFSPQVFAATGGPAAQTSPVRCWHVYHNGTLAYGGWGKMGTIHIAADLCNDGQHVWFKNGGSQPQCWTDNGYTGTAQVTWCGITRHGNAMEIGANIFTHATIKGGGWGPQDYNMESHDWIRDMAFPNSQHDPGPTGGTDVWWGTWNMN